MRPVFQYLAYHTRTGVARAHLQEDADPVFIGRPDYLRKVDSVEGLLQNGICSVFTVDFIWSATGAAVKPDAFRLGRLKKMEVPVRLFHLPDHLTMNG